MGRFHREWTPELDAKLERFLLKDGLSYKQAGSRLGVSRSSIASRCRKIGIKIPKKEPMRHAFAERLSIHGNIALAAEEIGTNRCQGHNLMGELRRDLGWQAV